MVRRIAVVLMLASLPACGGVSSPSKNRTETFPGTVPKGGSGPTHTFSSKAGELAITVTSLTPAVATSTQFYLFYGPFTSGQCFASPTVRIQGSTLNDFTYGSGTYCVYVQDAGFFQTDENYTLTVNHP